MLIPFTWPTDWTEWIQALDLWLSQVRESYPITGATINNMQALKDYAHANGLAVVMDESGNIIEFVKMNVVDPADTTQALPVPIEEFKESLEVAGTVAGYTFANGSTSYMNKAALVGTVLASLNATIQAGEVLSDIQSALEDSVTPYTKDGEHVPIYMTKHDGKYRTYVPEKVIDAVRQTAVDLGVFDVGYEPTTSAIQYAESLTTAPDWDNMTIGVADDISFYQTPQASELSYIDISDNQGTVLASFLRFANNPSRYYVVLTSAYPFKFRINAGGSPPPYQDAVSVTINGVSGYALSSTVLSQFDSARNNVPELAAPTYNVNLRDKEIQGMEYIMLTAVGGTGVQGITSTSSSASDMSKTLEDLLPDAWQNKIRLATPTLDDLFKRENYLPLGIETIDPFTDGTSEDSSDTQEGEITDPLKNPIIDLLDDLIHDLMNDPDNPIPPDYPVDDSGDTPPDDPPLTPGVNPNGSNGLWSIYNPTIGQVHDFGAWLWSDTLADQFKRIFNSPIDGIIGFHLLYATPSTGANKYIQCGFLTSPVSSATVTDQYTEIDCGTVTIDEYYRNALDYDNTRISIYLPFVGIVPLDSNVVMGSILSVTYRIDVLTGTCLAQIKVIKENSNAVMYAFDGNCAVQIPLTATTYTGMVGALLSGISAGASVMTGNLIQAVNSGFSAIARGYSGLTGVKQSGTFGANAGALGIRKPYVIITHPVSAMPAGFDSIEGLPSNVSVTLGALSGFTRVRSVHLENIGNATDEEITMIKDLLTEGVII